MPVDELLGEEELAILQKMARRQRKEWSMFKLEEGLWQGARPEEKVPDSIDAIVSLDKEPPPNWHRDKILIWIPIDDGLFPGLKWLQMVVNIIEDLRSAGKTVYIHCLAGVSRSTMVAAACLMKDNFWTYDQALEHIAKVNSKVNPNPRFMQGLKDWQAYLRNED